MVTGSSLLWIALETLGVMVMVGLILTLSIWVLMQSTRMSNRRKLLAAFLILGLVPVCGGLALSALPETSRSVGAVLSYAVFAAAIDLILAIRMSQQFFSPLVRLTAAVEQIAPDGSPAQARTRTVDEWKVLTLSIDRLNRQHQKAIQELQDKLAQHTRANQQLSEKSALRTAHLQNLSDIVQAITAITDLDQLVGTIAHLVATRYGFYHVGIYTTDENPETVLLRAASSEIGQRIPGRSYPISAGGVGLVSAAIQTRELKFSGEGAADGMPLTRSEIALPLLNGARVIGAIDLHSENTDVFGEEDLHLFAVLADQVAIALVNNRLFMDTRTALAEAQEIHSRYLRQEWKRENLERRYKAYQYHLGTIQPTEPLASPEVQAAFLTGEVTPQKTPEEINSQPAAERNGFSGTTLAVPIKLRNIVIGVINLQEVDPCRQWSKDEIEMVKSVADQIAIAVENARLLEQTLRRASRERKVFEITSKLRAINDPESMVKAAVAELRGALGADRAQVIIHSLPGVEIQDNGHGSADQTNTNITSL
jgi:GAF domain-containing protein